MCLESDTCMMKILTHWWFVVLKHICKCTTHVNTVHVIHVYQKWSKNQRFLSIYHIEQWTPPSLEKQNKYKLCTFTMYTLQEILKTSSQHWMKNENKISSNLRKVT